MRHADDGTLNAWLDGALAPEDAAAVAVHLEHCDACRTRLAEATHWRHDAAGLLASVVPSEVSPPPFEHILERAAGKPPAGPQPIVHHRPGAPLQPLSAWSTMAWAATIVLALLIGWYGRELVLRSGSSGQGADLAVRTGAPPATSPAAAPAPAAKGFEPVAPTVAVPDIPPPARGRAERTREAEYTGQGGPGGVLAHAGAEAREPGAPADAADRPEPTAAPLPAAAAPGAVALAESARAGAAQLAAGKVVALEAGKLAPTESARAIAVRGAAAAPKAVAAAAPESLRVGRRADAGLRDTTIAFGRDALSLNAVAVTGQKVLDAPTFTPYTVAPVLANRADVQQALVAYYPTIERASGIGGTTTVWLFLDDRGTVRNTLVKLSSGHVALDSAALRVARVMRFTPALDRDRPVRAWVTLPITFGTGP